MKDLFIPHLFIPQIGIMCLLVEENNSHLQLQYPFSCFSHINVVMLPHSANSTTTLKGVQQLYHSFASSRERKYPLYPFKWWFVTPLSCGLLSWKNLYPHYIQVRPNQRDNSPRMKTLLPTTKEKTNQPHINHYLIGVKKRKP